MRFARIRITAAEQYIIEQLSSLDDNARMDALLYGLLGSRESRLVFNLKEAHVMLFMAIFSYSPEDRNLVVERGIQSADKESGVEVKGEWFDISGHRVFRLFEAEDEVHLAASIFNWTDLGVAEIIPVMNTEKALKLLKRISKR